MADRRTYPRRVRRRIRPAQARSPRQAFVSHTLTNWFSAAAAKQRGRAAVRLVDQWIIGLAE